MKIEISNPFPTFPPTFSPTFENPTFHLFPPVTMIRSIEGNNAEVNVYTGEGGIDAVPRDVLRVRVDPSVTKVPGVDKDEN